MYCEKCGTELTDEIVKCPKCGNEVKKEESNSKQSENKIDIKKLKKMIKSNIRYVYLNTHKTQVCHKYIFNGTLLNRQ